MVKNGSTTHEIWCILAEQALTQVQVGFIAIRHREQAAARAPLQGDAHHPPGSLPHRDSRGPKHP